MPDAAPIAGSTSWPPDGPRPVVTIGNFDGVHLGHRTLLDRTQELARALGALPTAFTFHPAPRDVLRPGNPVARIQSLDDRVRDLHAHGMQRVVVEPFDLDYAAHDAEWFARVVLAQRLRAAAVVVGWDFRFGRGRGGSVDTLRHHLDVPVEQVQARSDGSEPVSSSRIRRCIAAGDVREAARLLGRAHSLVGRVVTGDARGRQLGFRTANVQVEAGLLPALGVYAVWLHSEGMRWRGVANLGTRPTFEAGDVAPRLEVHVLDFDGDLYGDEARVTFVQRLRPEIAFPSKEALIRQISQDVEGARAALEP